MGSLESLILVLASAAIPLLALHLWAFVYPTGRIKPPAACAPPPSLIALGTRLKQFLVLMTDGNLSRDRLAKSNPHLSVVPATNLQRHLESQRESHIDLRYVRRQSSMVLEFTRE